MSLSIVLLYVSSLQQQTPQNPSAKDALALLTEVSQRYAGVKSYHIEMIEERTSDAELSRSWQKTFMTAIAMPGGRYRHEGRSGAGSAVYVSDGIHRWDYLPAQNVYTQRLATNEDSKHPHLPEEIAALNAKSAVSVLAHLSDVLQSATFLPDETVVIGGKSTECFVVHSVDQDFKVRHPATSRESTVWIDKTRRLIVKRVDRETHLSTQSADGRIPTLTEATIEYPVVELGQEEPASSFSFPAPDNAQLVETFPSPFASGPRLDLVGKPALELRLKSAEGIVTALSSLRGKPVFLDFWATWCGPCRGLVPDLLKLYEETSGLGLVWLGIDNDENPDAAAKFVSQNHIPWRNYHDMDGSMGAAFQRNAIPLGALIDGRGNISFYQLSYDVSDLRGAIAKLGPEFKSVASTNANGNSAQSK